MATIDETLLGRQTLANEKEEAAAAAGLRAEKARAKGGEIETTEETGLGATFKQGTMMARNAAAPPQAPAADGGGAAPASTGTSLWLKAAWLNLIDSFGLTLIYINLHVFGHSVLGEKVFCELGEEWIPNNLRASLESDAVKGMIKRFGLLEKCILILLDLIALLALLLIVVLIVFLITWLTNWLNIAKAIPGLVWDWMTGLLSAPK